MIENPRTGEQVERIAETPEVLTMITTWTRPGHRATEHIHPIMEDSATKSAPTVTTPRTGDRSELRDGDRMLIACTGGTGRSRLVRYPPPLELPEPGGIYVLVDEGPTWAWRYGWVPDER